MRQDKESMNFAEKAAVQHNWKLLYKIADALCAAQDTADAEGWFSYDGVVGTSRLMEVLTESMQDMLGSKLQMPVVDVEDTDVFILPFALAMLYARLNLQPMGGDHLGMLAELEYMMDAIISGEWFDE